jgi:hypothetical protein
LFGKVAIKMLITKATLLIKKRHPYSKIFLANINTIEKAISEARHYGEMSKLKLSIARPVCGKHVLVNKCHEPERQQTKVTTLSSQR